MRALRRKTECLFLLKYSTIREFMKRKFLFMTSFIKQSRTLSLILFEIITGICLSLFSLYTFIGLTEEVFEKDVNFYDESITRLIFLLRTPFLTKIMLMVTSFGAEYLLITASLMTIFLVYRRHKQEAVLFSLVLSMGFILNTILKHLTQRPRPNISQLTSSTFSSFPSGHAMNSFVFYTLLAYYTYHFTRSKKLSLIVSVVAFTAIVLIGFSRVYLGVHYPSDVLAGYLVGFWWFVTAIVIDKTITFFKLFKESRKRTS